MGLNTWLGGFIGSATASGASEVINGVGDAALKVRSAITGNMTPDKAAEVELHLADLEAKISASKDALNAVDAASASFFVAGWRPAIGWLGALGIAYQVFIWPMLTWASTIWGVPAPPAIDTGALMTILVSMLGVGTMRTVEKVKGVHAKH